MLGDVSLRVCSTVYTCAEPSSISLLMATEAAPCLAVVNSAAGEVGAHVAFSNYGFVQIYAQSGLAGSYGSYIFSFVKELYSFSMAVL